MSPPSVALDTSVAVPLLVATHRTHADLTVWARGRTLALCGHAAVETYSVLTRLPGDLRVSAEDVVRLIDGSFAEILALSPAVASTVHRRLARAGIVGGAVYDGLVALTAVEHGFTLATRDARARSTYEAVGAVTEVI